MYIGLSLSKLRYVTMFNIYKWYSDGKKSRGASNIIQEIVQNRSYKIIDNRDMNISLLKIMQTITGEGRFARPKNI